MGRILELFITAVLAVILIVLICGGILVVLAGLLMIPLAFPLTTLILILVALTWLGAAWFKKGRELR